MIISVSRRTDIPAFFSEWFFRRIEEQYACVRNPMNFHQVSKISLSPDVVDCIVFWSKNPEPMLEQLPRLDSYQYYFQFTLNAYGRDLERNLPPLARRIQTFRKLSEIIGEQRVLWRYDPVILNESYPIDWHIAHFSSIAEALSSYTRRCTISFVDLYTNISKRMQEQKIRELHTEEKIALADALSPIARSCGMSIGTCAEDIDLSAFGIEHAHCIDAGLIAKLTGCSMDVEKDKNQRPICGCAASIDLGLYNTCQNGCSYCYANHSPSVRARNFQAYDKDSSLLCSQLTSLDKITERKVKSQKDAQLSLFSM